MNTTYKYAAIGLTIIVIVAAVVGYMAYTGAFTNNNPAATPTPPPTTSPTTNPSTNPTGSPTNGPTSKPTGTSPTNSPTATANPTGARVDLRVFIASSLVHVVENMTAEFERTNNVHLIVDSDSSSALYTRIVNQAPCDVFMSADQKWTKQLNDASLLYGNTVNFTTNSLEVIVAPGNPGNVNSLADLARPGVKVVLAAPSVPAGSYANTTIWKIQSKWGGTDAAYANFNQSVYNNVVSYETSVENVVGKVSLGVGTADAGIVFKSDGVFGSMSNSHATFITIPSDVNTQGIYGIAVVKQVQNSSPAQAFMNFWSSTQGQALLTQFGFNS